MTLVDETMIAEDREIRSIQEHEFPEGAPPARDVNRKWAVVALICLSVLALGTIATLFLLDGASAVLVGGAMLVAYIAFGGAAAVLGVIERARVRRKIHDRLHPDAG